MTAKERVDKAIIATKRCTKVLMKMCYNDFANKQKLSDADNRISNKSISKNNY